MLLLVAGPGSVISEGAVGAAAPPPRQCQEEPPGSLTRERLSGARPGRFASGEEPLHGAARPVAGVTGQVTVARSVYPASDSWPSVSFFGI